MRSRLACSGGLFGLILILALAVAAGTASAENSAGIGLSLTRPGILGVFAEMEVSSGLTVQGNIGIDREQDYDIVGFGIRGIYEVFPAVGLVGGYTQWQDNTVIMAGLRYTDRIDRIAVFGGVSYQYVLESKKGNPGVEAGFRFLLANRWYLGVEGGYHLMEDGTPGVSAYAGYVF
ncbi:MAG: hypothetical protein IMX00_00005 [Limnochordales bacterium]|nr:hypothetical protein [Limnochordales bacterium]